MKTLIALIAMIELHIFADFHLQGILAKMKQKEWWTKNAYRKDWSKVSRDYRTALVTHAFEWTFFMMLPIVYSALNFSLLDKRSIGFEFLFIFNMIFHAAIDDGKANDHAFGILTDQALHLLQIIITWLIWTVAFGW